MAIPSRLHFFKASSQLPERNAVTGKQEVGVEKMLAATQKNSELTNPESETKQQEPNIQKLTCNGAKRPQNTRLQI